MGSTQSLHSHSIHYHPPDLPDISFFHLSHAHANLNTDHFMSKSQQHIFTVSPPVLHPSAIFDLENHDVLISFWTRTFLIHKLFLASRPMRHHVGKLMLYRRGCFGFCADSIFGLYTILGDSRKSTSWWRLGSTL